MIFYSLFSRRFNYMSIIILIDYNSQLKEATSPSYSDQSDLNVPDIVITAYQLVNMNFPEGIDPTEIYEA